MLFFVFCEMALFFGAYSFLGVLLRERFDLSFTLVGLIIAGFGVGGLIYSSLVRILLARFGQRGCVLLGGTLGGSLYLAILVVPNWPLAMLCTVGMGFSFYAMHNTLQTKATEMAPQSRASALGCRPGRWCSRDERRGPLDRLSAHDCAIRLRLHSARIGLSPATQPALDATVDSKIWIPLVVPRIRQSAPRWANNPALTTPTRASMCDSSARGSSMPSPATSMI